MFQARHALFDVDKVDSRDQSETDEKKVVINQLATHLPDAVVFSDHTKKLPFQIRFQAVLLYLDISGFTALCEKYASNSKVGADQLTRTLNAYMSALVGEILCKDGDVIKFAGDSILTLWQVKSFSEMKAAVSHVISCAMNIQNTYGVWNTNDGVQLRVKIGLAAGEVCLTFIGNEELLQYVLLGRGVDAVNLAESFCSSGDIVASPSLWCHCYKLEVEHKILDDNKHIKIISFEDPNSVPYQFMNIVTLSPSESRLVDAMQNTDDMDLDPSDASQALLLTSPNKRKIVRRAIVYQPCKEEVAKQRLYLSKTVLRNMEKRQPLEYLSEIRQLSICFINLAIQECTYMELAVILQKSFDIIYSHVSQNEGCLSKIFAFEKGSTFVVVFGLPGFKTDNDSAHALLCASEIHGELSKVKPVLYCSIGVTTGSTFCGVLGHNYRHEYTVIGSKVNMAARLMMYYPSKVTCDNETYQHSKLSKANFRPQEAKELKGLSNVGVIREYIPSAGSLVNDIPLDAILQYPILGRNKELDLFVSEVNKFSNQPDSASKRLAIVFEGVSGVGRSRFLEAAVIKVMNMGIRVVVCSLTMNDMQIPNYLVKSLLFDLLHLSLDMSCEKRQDIFTEMFKDDPFITEHAFLLNDFLHVQFPEEKILSPNEKRTTFQEVTHKLIRECCKVYGFIVFAIDDAQFLDPDSWDFINILGKAEASLVVMTVCIPFTMSDTARAVLKNVNTLRVTLKAISPIYLAGLTCQLLGVSMIPKELDRMLWEKIQGMPLWCEQLLQELIKYDVIHVTRKPLNDDHIMIKPPNHYLIKRKGIAEPIQMPVDAECEVLDPKLACIIAEDKSLDIQLPDSVTGAIQTRIDHMNDRDQIIVKTAALLGVCFPRPLLEVILPETISHKLCGESIKHLAASDIFVCGYASNQQTQVSCDMDSDILKESVICMCPDANGETFPKPMDQCQLVMFLASTLQQTAYEMFLENTRRPLHVKAAKFLESQKYRCKCCGGGSSLHDLLLKQHEIEKISPEGLSHSAAQDSSSNKLKNDNDSGNSIRMSPWNMDKCYQGGECQMSGVAQTLRVLLGRLLFSSPSQSQPIAGSLPISDDRKPPENYDLSNTNIYQSLDTSTTVRLCLSSCTSFLRKDEEYDPVAVQEQYSQDYIHLAGCQCNSIIHVVCCQLIKHWRAAGNISKTIHYLLEASAAAVRDQDKKMAFSYLGEINRIFDAVRAKENPFKGEVEVIAPYSINKWQESKLYSLMGQTLFHTGEMEKSVPHFHQALARLGCKQPSSKLKETWSLVRNFTIYWSRSRHFHPESASTGDQDLYSLKEKLLCLGHLLHWYLIRNKTQLALNTILQQINKVQSVDTDIQQVLMVHMCMMESCHIFKWLHLARVYQDAAQSRCLTALDDVPVDDLVMIIHFFLTSLHFKLCWGDIEQAVDIGYTAYAITKKLRDKNSQLLLLPVLTKALLLSNRFTDAVESVRRLKKVEEKVKDDISKELYYALCLDITLETDTRRFLSSGCTLYPQSDMLDIEYIYFLAAGAQCEHYTKCLNYTPVGPECPKTRHYRRATIALWFIRTGDSSTADQYFSSLNDAIWSPTDNYITVQAFVKVLEFRLIRLAQILSSKSKSSTVVVQHELLIRKGLSSLKHICKNQPVFQPRYSHLLAYDRAIHGNNVLAKLYLTKSISVARRMDNSLEAEWAEHSWLVWFSPYHSELDASTWLKRIDQKPAIEGNTDDKVAVSRIMYCLPLPHWFKQG